MMIKQSVINLLFVIFVLVSVKVEANLMISPTRVAFVERDRSKEVLLINSSNKVKSYRIEWVQNKALPDGSYQVLDQEQSKEFATASSMLRVSPKQVTLRPGASQTIKLALRRRPSATAEEFRSHLKLTALPDKELRQTQSDEGMGIRLEALVSYTIPVIVRTGVFDAKVQIKELVVAESGNRQNAEIKLLLERTGPHSASGNFKAYLTTPGQAEKEVGKLNGFNFFHEVDKSVASLVWPDYRRTTGKLRVVYEGRQELKGKILAESTFDLTPDKIRSSMGR